MSDNWAKCVDCPSLCPPVSQRELKIKAVNWNGSCAFPWFQRIVGTFPHCPCVIQLWTGTKDNDKYTSLTQRTHTAVAAAISADSDSGSDRMAKNDFVQGFFFFLSIPLIFYPGSSAPASLFHRPRMTSWPKIKASYLASTNAMTKKMSPYLSVPNAPFHRILILIVRMPLIMPPFPPQIFPSECDFICHLFFFQGLPPSPGHPLLLFSLAAGFHLTQWKCHWVRKSLLCFSAAYRPTANSLCLLGLQYNIKTKAWGDGNNALNL